MVANGWPADSAFWELKPIVDTWEEMLDPYDDAAVFLGFGVLVTDPNRPKRSPGIGEIITATQPYHQQRVYREARARREERFRKDDEAFNKLNDFREEEYAMARSERRDVDSEAYQQRFVEWVKARDAKEDRNAD